MQAHLIFRALSDATRLRLAALLSRGPLNVQQLTTIVGVSQSTISHHLRVLQSARVINGQKNGTFVFYSMNNREEAPFAAETVDRFVHMLEQAEPGDELAQQIKRDLAEVTRLKERRRAQTQDYFESHAAEWDKLRKRIPAIDASLPRLIECIPKSGTVAELGCGTGVLLKQITPRKGKTIGVDSSDAMLEQARKVLSKPEEVEFRLGQLEHLPLGDETVECAVSHMVFHHLADPVEAIRDIARVLKSGGKLLISDLGPHDNEKLRQELATVWLGFDPKELTRWVRQAGFQSPEFEFFGEHREVFLLSANKK